MRCPGCGNSLSHKDLRKKRCSSCSYILPVIQSTAEERQRRGQKRSTLNPLLPPPQRRPLSLEVSAMDGEQLFQAGDLVAKPPEEEPVFTNEPSIAADEDAPPPVRPQVPRDPPTPSRQKRTPRGPRRSQYEATVKVNMESLMEAEEQRQVPKRRLRDDLLLILSIIICALLLTAVLIMYLK